MFVNNNWDAGGRADLICRVMKPNVLGGSGGGGKIGFLLKETFAHHENWLSVPNNAPLTELMFKVVDIAADRHRKDSQRLMENYEAFFHAFEGAFGHAWPDSDGAVAQIILHSSEETVDNRSASDSTAKRSPPSDVQLSNKRRC